MGEDTSLDDGILLRDPFFNTKPSGDQHTLFHPKYESL
jgi:hypothetical protein